MSGLKEIRRRIGSVASTKQVTKAMKLVSAAKLRKVQELVHSGRYFAFKLGSIVLNSIEDIKRSGQEFHHVLLERKKNPSKARMIILGSDRGLCGGYNVNLFKAVEAARLRKTHLEFDFVLFGKQAVNIAKRFGYNVVREYIDIPEQLSMIPIDELTHEIISDFTNDRCDKVYICYTKFNSTSSQQVVVEKILPLSLLKIALNEEVKKKIEAEHASMRGILYSPSPQRILATVLPIMLTVLIKQAIIEAKTSEYAARMIAMDSATHNADELIDQLKLFYNRARQSSITAELLDVLGGANALK